MRAILLQRGERNFGVCHFCHWFSVAVLQFTQAPNEERGESYPNAKNGRSPARFAKKRPRVRPAEARFLRQRNQQGCELVKRKALAYTDPDIPGLFRTRGLFLAIF